MDIQQLGQEEVCVETEWVSIQEEVPPKTAAGLGTNKHLNLSW